MTHHVIFIHVHPKKYEFSHHLLNIMIQPHLAFILPLNMKEDHLKNVSLLFCFQVIKVNGVQYSSKHEGD